MLLTSVYMFGCVGRRHDIIGAYFGDNPKPNPNPSQKKLYCLKYISREMDIWPIPKKVEITICKKVKMTKTHKSWFCDNRPKLWVTLHKCHCAQKEWFALVRQNGSFLLFWQMHSWCVRLCKCKGRNLSPSIRRPQWPLNCALCECDNDRPTCWLNCLNSTQHSLHFFYWTHARSLPCLVSD